MFRRPFAMLATLAALAVAAVAPAAYAAVPSPGVGVIHDVALVTTMDRKLTTSTFILSRGERADYATTRRLTRAGSERRTLDRATVDMTSIDFAAPRATPSEVGAIRRGSVR